MNWQPNESERLKIEVNNDIVNEYFEKADHSHMKDLIYKSQAFESQLIQKFKSLAYVAGFMAIAVNPGAAIYMTNKMGIPKNRAVKFTIGGICVQSYCLVVYVNSTIKSLNDSTGLKLATERAGKENTRKIKNLSHLQKDARIKCKQENTIFHLGNLKLEDSYDKLVEKAKTAMIYDESDEVPVVVRAVENSQRMMKTFEELNQQKSVESEFGEQGNFDQQQSQSQNQTQVQNFGDAESQSNPVKEEDPYVKMMRESAEKTNSQFRKKPKWDD